MNVFDYAMQMEKDGEKYYRELANSTVNSGLKTVLTFLADEEVIHFNIFQNMKDGKGMSLPFSNLLTNVKNVFIEMREKGDNYDFDAKQVEYYKKALETENKSEAFYRESADETTAIHERKLLNAIADEEKRHAGVLEGIIDFIQEPETWLENAEWSQIGRSS
ncbi:MAG: ferritin family protein [Candidatus Brocadiales bacterium]|nr:ferritin family protein [Candidatus Brocadiales bacterium]